MIRKLLVANRGEIACRVIRTAKKLGIKTVAVHSEADAKAPHVEMADESVLIGPPPPPQSYLNTAAILEAARRTGADGVHPGYGFLSENGDFVHAVRGAGLVFVGPEADAMHQMGDKGVARRIVQAAGVPTVPGSAGIVQTADDAKLEADRIGYPVLLKAAAGGGGIGMTLVKSGDEIVKAFESSSSRAQKAFGDGSLYIEKFIENPHHIEVQVFGDTHGSVIHLFERECSVQRRHQKIIEETPAPLLIGRNDVLGKIFDAAVLAAKAVNYTNAGTIEFIADEKGNFYFIEMNTRLQVEHPVTEAVTGLDLVEWQLRVAVGERLPLAQSEVKRSGAAVECRICAENPAKNFFPAPGKIDELVWGDGMRVDTGVRAGSEITPFYDPMVAKVIGHGATRSEAIDRLSAALDKTVIKPLQTNLNLHRHVLREDRFRAGKYDTNYLATLDLKQLA
ncbi:MAG: acetyl-CoA carboxylase biotin carboxylase subunit [Deltaproteobacteria bacterium]|nr:acetyl-CoA carboxylase biotin carboxylase subunit [Deltaproteobacteria bacterium]